MKKLIMILTCIFASVGLSVAQTTRVSGTVLDDTGETVIGASVVAKGTTVGTVTDIDGNFSMNIPSDKKTLIVSLIGYKAKEVTAGNGLTIVLEADSKLIDEVVVTGYGTVKKASFTGAASVLSTSKLENIPSVSLEAKLAGQAAGVKFGSSTGAPGALESVRIRGASSINASNEPLYVIDGVPMDAGNASIFSYSQTGNSILSTINSNDIESITIIKDAGAAALYGSRAANGVIVITTKSGKEGRSTVNFRGSWGFSNMAIDYRPTLGGDDRREILYQGLVNYQTNVNNETSDPSKHLDPVEYANGKIDTYAEKPWSGWADWKDLLMRTGKQENYEVSVQTGNAKTAVFSSLSYTKIEGITKKSQLDRITGRLNMNHKAGQKFLIGMNAMFTSTKQNNYSEGTSYASPLMAISMTASPQDYPYNEDGSFNTTKKFRSMSRPLANPLYALTVNYDKSDISRFLGSAYAQYNIYDGLSAKQTISYDFIQTNNRVWWDPASNDGLTAVGNYQRYMVNRDKFISQTHLAYKKVFNKLHSFDALIGYEVEKWKEDWVNARGSNYPNRNKEEIVNASTTVGYSAFEENRMISYLGFLNYNYDNKYYVSTSYRRDGSTKFRRSDRWGDFWSVSGSWRITQEPFAESFKSILTDAKVRASYGVNGNLPIDNYEYMDVFGYGYRYNGSQGAAEDRIAYGDLTWEKNRSLNVGLDLSFIDRIDVVFDWYTRDTKDLLLEKSLSYTTGFETSMMNLGQMNNQGFELLINSRNIISKDFQWTTSFNIAHNKNELKKLDGVQTEMAGENTRLRHYVGRPFSTLYGYEYAGVDPATGKESFYKNAEGEEREVTINPAEATRIPIGKVDPTVSGGLTNNFMYKSFDLGFTFTYSFGGHVYDGASGWLGSGGGSMNYNGNVPSYWKLSDTWQKSGDNAKLPQFREGGTTQVSSRWVRSTDHLRLKNITLGYTLPRNILNALKIENVRIYASAVNLFTVKPKNLVVDPEIPVDPTDGIRTYGISTYQTPQLRTVTFGIDISF